MPYIALGTMTAAVAMALVLPFRATPALAHDKHGEPVHTSYPTIQGMLINVNTGNLQIQTQTASLTIPTTPSTHVVRMVSGSLADLHVNQHVDAHLAQSTKTIDRIQIEASKWYRNNPLHFDGTGSPDTRVWAYTNPTGVDNAMPRHSDLKTTRQAPSEHPSSYVSGQVVSIGKHSVTLSGSKSKQMTYSFSGSLVVTKILNGTPGDLSFGETLRVTRDHNGNAVCVVILSA